MERTDLISGLDLERLGSTAEVSPRQGKNSAREKDSKARRRAASSEDDLGDLQVDKNPPHQIDRLA